MSLTLFILILLTSCQVKQASTEGGLISGHAPVTNAFSVSLPANGTYSAGGLLNFTLAHPFVLTVTGNPRLSLTIGSTTVYANYVSGSGTKNLLFSYTIQSGDNDADGISVGASLDLNGGSIVFNTNMDVSLSLTMPSSAGIRVDTSAPAITGASIPFASHYYLNTSLVFRVNFDENVVVTGTPTIDFTVDECTTAGTYTKSASYAGGNRTKTLTFTYPLETNCNETSGIPLNTSIQLNGGTIRDEAGNAASLDFSAFLVSPLPGTIQIRGRYPAVYSVTPPGPGIYTPGASLDVKVRFDRVVTVSASTSYINFTLGTDSSKQFQYLSGTGTNELTYRYIVMGGDVDSDGINLTNDIVNEGTICSGAFCLVNGESDVFPTPITSGVIVDAPIPSIIGIQLPSPLPSSGYYKLGEMVQVIVKFSEPVTIAGGTPELSALVGATPRIFSYLSGSGTSNIIFSYDVQNTDLDTDGVSFTSPLARMGATIQNAQGTNASLDFSFTVNPSFRFDGIPPTILSSEIATLPASNHPDYRLNQYIYIDLTFSEEVTVSGSTLGLTVGASARTANYQSSISPTVKRFRYRVQTSDHTSNQASTVSVATTLTGGVVQDVALNDITDRTVPATDTTGVEIDGAIPTVSSFILPANAIYKNGSVLNFTVNFSEPVTVSGSPTWALTLGAGGPESATYVSGSGTSALIFSYTVDGDDLDTDGISLAGTFSLGGGSITDSSVGNNLTNSFTPPNTSGIRVDGVIPTVINISGPAAATYTELTQLDFNVTYSEAVTITGAPQLVLDIGGATKYANYVSGSGTNTALYRYTVESGLTDLNGVQVTGHILNSGTIRDAADNAADLTVSPMNFNTVLVDSRGPLITSITPPSAGLKVTGETLSFTIDFDENVYVAGGTPSLALDIGGTTVNATYDSGSGSSSLVFTTPLTADHFAPDGISYVGSSLQLNGSTMKDGLGHDANISFTAVDISGIKIIYSGVISWLQASSATGANGAVIPSLTDLSTKNNSATANSGTVTKISSDVGLGNKASADFDGFSSLILPALSVRTIIIAFRASTNPSNSDLLANGSVGLILTNNTDLNFGSSARYAIGTGGFSGWVTDCTSCYDSSTNKVLSVDFSITQSMTPFLGRNLDGRIAEVWVLDGTQVLSDIQIQKISNYLAGKY